MARGRDDAQLKRLVIQLLGDKRQLEEKVATLERKLGDVAAASRRAEERCSRLSRLLQDVAVCASGEYCYGCPHQHDGCDRDERLRAEGIEVPE